MVFCFSGSQSVHGVSAPPETAVIDSEPTQHPNMTANLTPQEEEAAARQALETAYQLLGLTEREAAQAAAADLVQFAAEEANPWN